MLQASYHTTGYIYVSCYRLAIILQASYHTTGYLYIMLQASLHTTGYIYIYHATGYHTTGYLFISSTGLRIYWCVVYILSV